ncbi:SusE outer membrane protein [Chitinophaga costaii]|uniref:SusE outer membrane protein n=1 Tax=Chitinophaga costaii TaxID=1335309 RepID=A0A1C4FNG1_9BACT|nr:SusE domain-containing protein [Chitinophaga costaii]PUZ29933.1 hypothetical protein DCM91_00155 [Chitinophaga costaii]SCC57193.1 SusE outer membrane protein [Chitinophaga costaii]
MSIKYFSRYFLAAAAVLLAFSSCKKDKKVSTVVTPVSNFFAPQDSQYIKLQPTSAATVTFEWEQSLAADGGLVQYELLFDKDGGDFSKPVYSVASDNNGLYNKATVTHKDLNKIAALAGIESLGVGKLKWAVLATKGVNGQKSTITRTLIVERPAGFADIPTDVYLTGSATEAGDDLSKAIRLKALATGGEFEIYTSLKPGTYHFVDKTTGTPNTFAIQGNQISSGNEITVSGTDTKVYRISLDFNNAAAKLTEIKSLGLWYCADNAIRFPLNYIGNGTWKLTNTEIDFVQESYGGEERYKFRLTTNDGTNDGTEWWGSSNSDNQRPTDASPAAYFYLNIIASSDQWNYAFKFNGNVDKQHCDINVYFSPDKANYTHEVIINK